MSGTWEPSRMPADRGATATQHSVTEAGALHSAAMLAGDIPQLGRSSVTPRRMTLQFEVQVLVFNVAWLMWIAHNANPRP